jgi:AAA domain
MPADDNAARIMRGAAKADKPNGEAKPALDISTLCLSPEDWEFREIHPEDTLLGPFSTTTRTEIAADTGLGKTMLGLGIGHAKATGSDFLHWKAGRAGRVLFVDGEMPPGLIQARLRLARSWFDLPDPLPRNRMCVLSKMDVDDQMPPLDTPKGERWIMSLIEQLGRFDAAIFDNRASLTSGDQSGDDASCSAVKHLQRELTKLSIGQIWLHHTGYDASRGYGRKSREWELDTVAVGERLEGRPDADVAMKITFKKARRRTPENRADYDPIEVELVKGQWLWQPIESEKSGGGANGKDKALGTNQQAVFDAAAKLIAAGISKAPPGHPAGHRTVISIDMLKEETRRMLACDPKHYSSRFDDALNRLVGRRKLGLYTGYVWLP